jgi:hypothetical protein
MQRHEQQGDVQSIDYAQYLHWRCYGYRQNDAMATTGRRDFVVALGSYPFLCFVLESTEKTVHDEEVVGMKGCFWT